MSRRHRFYGITLENPEAVERAIAESSRVRVYESPKYPGIMMVKILDSMTDITGRLSLAEFEQIRHALQPFAATPDKKATIYSRAKALIDVRLYLEYVVVVIETQGWKPASSGGRPTWLQALDLYNDRQPLTQTAIALAEEILTAMVEPEEADSDYAQRLADILKQKETHPGNLRMLASAPVAFDRRRAREAAARVSQHVGTVGEVYQADFLEVLYRGAVDTSRGQTWLYKLRDQSGNMFTCWHDEPRETKRMEDRILRIVRTPNEWEKWEEKHRGVQDRLPLHFAGPVTIVAHQQYMGVKETVISVNCWAVRSIGICPACGGRYDQGQCSCIQEPSLYTFEPEEFDVEIEG